MTEGRRPQPVGEPVIGWTRPPRPDGRTLTGRTCRLVQLDPEMDAPALFEAFAPAGEELWTYLPFGPPRDAAELAAIHRALIEQRGAVSYAIRVGDRPVGVAPYRKAMVVKGRNRDTNWLSITDDEWPARRAELLGWLEPTNFDASGAQRRPLR